MSDPAAPDEEPRTPRPEGEPTGAAAEEGRPTDPPTRSGAVDGPRGPEGAPPRDEPEDSGEPGIWPVPPVLVAPLLWATDLVAARATGRRTTVRWRTSPFAALRGRVEVLTVGIHGMQVRGLELDRVVARVEDARLHPGLEPRVTGGPVTTSVTVTQDGVDRWIGRVGLPFRLELTPEGIVSSAGMGALRVGRLLTQLDVTEGWLRLRPVRAVGRTLPKAVGVALTGNLPLPALPEEARLEGVRHRDGELSADFALADLDEPIDLGTADRFRARLDAISPARED